MMKSKNNSAAIAAARFAKTDTFKAMTHADWEVIYNFKAGGPRNGPSGSPARRVQSGDHARGN